MHAFKFGEPSVNKLIYTELRTVFSASEAAKKGCICGLTLLFMRSNFEQTIFPEESGTLKETSSCRTAYNVIPMEKLCLTVLANGPVETFLLQALNEAFEVKLLHASQCAMDWENEKTSAFVVLLSEQLTTTRFYMDLTLYSKASRTQVLWLPFGDYSQQEICACFEAGYDCLLPEMQKAEYVLAKIRGKMKNPGQLLERASSVSIKYEDKAKVHPPFIVKLYDYLEKHHLDKDFSIEKMGSDLGMSRTKFFSRVKALTFGSPSKLVMNFRLQLAVQELKKGDRTITTVAFDVGFTSIAYFTRCFKKCYGVSPSRFFEQQHLEEEQNLALHQLVAEAFSQEFRT